MLRHALLLPLISLPLACGGSSAPKGEPTASQATPVHGPDGDNPHTHGAHKHDAHQHGAHKHGAHKHGDPRSNPIGHRFQDADKWAKRFDDPKRDAWQKPADVVALMQIEPGMTVADIGAGTGYFLPYLSAAAGETGSVLGIDVEANMVRYMELRAEREQLKNVKAQTAGAADPELSLNSVDRVLIVDTWHHIPERVAYAKKIASGLRAGGKVFIVDFTMETERGPHKEHRLSAESIVAELTEAGLTASIIAEDLPDQYIVQGQLP